MPLVPTNFRDLVAAASASQVGFRAKKTNAVEVIIVGLDSFASFHTWTYFIGYFGYDVAAFEE